MLRSFWFLWLFLVAAISGLGFGMKAHRAQMPKPETAEAVTARVAVAPLGSEVSSAAAKAIAHAQSEVLLAARDFDSSVVADALASAASRGVRVQVVLDSRFRTNATQGMAGYLKERGLGSVVLTAPVTTNWLVIDGRLVLEAGPNVSARSANDHVAIVIHSSVGGSYRDAFLSLARSATPLP